MPSKRANQASPPEGPARLKRPKAQAEQALRRQIEEGIELRDRSIQNESQLEAARSDYHIWNDYNDTLLSSLFEGESERKRYAGGLDVFFAGGLPPLEDQIRSFLADVDEKVQRLESLVNRIDLFEEIAPIQTAVPQPAESAVVNRRVFVVHGRDEGLKQSVARFIDTIELKAIVLEEQPGLGRTIIEKFEDHASNVGYAVVLLTPDDVGKLDGSASPEQKRARQNVLFELGYFAGKLGRGKVCLLKRGELEIPSDLAGVECLSYDGDWQLKLAREMRAAKLPANINRLVDAV